MAVAVRFIWLQNLEHVRSTHQTRISDVSKAQVSIFGKVG